MVSIHVLRIIVTTKHLTIESPRRKIILTDFYCLYTYSASMNEPIINECAKKPSLPLPGQELTLISSYVSIVQSFHIIVPSNKNTLKLLKNFYIVLESQKFINNMCKD
jgi:hypothetical protein